MLTLRQKDAGGSRVSRREPGVSGRTFAVFLAARRRSLKRVDLPVWQVSRQPDHAPRPVGGSADHSIPPDAADEEQVVGRLSFLAVIKGRSNHVENLLKPSDLVRRLGTSRSWVYDRAKNGDIPAIRLGDADGPLRFIEQDVESWIDDARARWRPGHAPVSTRPRPPSQTSRRRSEPSTPPRHAPPSRDEPWTQLELDA